LGKQAELLAIRGHAQTKPAEQQRAWVQEQDLFVLSFCSQEPVEYFLSAIPKGPMVRGLQNNRTSPVEPIAKSVDHSIHRSLFLLADKSINM
jgi:hypothetical protein